MGCGIGLHISQKIINQLGSNIQVRSTPNEGSVFYFSLPIDQDSNTVERTETEIKIETNRDRLNRRDKTTCAA